jgi:hypothetical protein
MALASPALPAKIKAGRPVSQDCVTINALIDYVRWQRGEIARLTQALETLKRDLPPVPRYDDCYVCVDVSETETPNIQQRIAAVAMRGALRTPP